jgi:hypothetical protein
MLRKEGIRHRLKEGMNSVAVVDAAIRTLKITIAKKMADIGSESWAKAVPQAVNAYNAKSHRALMNSALEDVQKTPVLIGDAEQVWRCHQWQHKRKGPH